MPPSPSRSPRRRGRSSSSSAAAMAVPPLPNLDSDRGAIASVDCNLAALCDHILIEGFNSGAFSDVVVCAMGSTYRLHRLILSRSSYFRNMLHGPWKESDSLTVTMQIDDDNVNSEAIEAALAYLYGHHPKLSDGNAFRVLAAASFLDLQDLCAMCTDFIISELWTTNFLAYQMFAERQDYGVHGERVRKACWGYLCQSGAMELREVLPKLSSQTLHSLLTSDRLWVPDEEKRFELALYALLAKSALLKKEEGQARLSPRSRSVQSDSSTSRGKNPMDLDGKRQHMKIEFGHLSIRDNAEDHKDSEVRTNGSRASIPDFQNVASHSKPIKLGDLSSSLPVVNPHSCQMDENGILSGTFSDANIPRASCSYADLMNQSDADRMGIGSPVIGPSEESTSHFATNIWLPNGQPSSDHSSCNELINSEWTNGSMVPSSWGARMVGSRQSNNATVDSLIRREEYDTFANIFEGGSLLYSNMSFEALLDVRKQLEDLGFPCKAVNDGLWLQMLLSHKVQEIGADTCRNCCLTSMSCACRQPYGYSQGGTSTGYYRQEHDRGNTTGNLGNIYFADAQGDGSGMYGPVRVHVRGPIDGLAGIGRGTTFVSGSAWPPTRFVFSRVPCGLGSRNSQQSPANEESNARLDINGDIPGDGLTALVGSNQSGNIIPVHLEQAERVYVAGPAIFPNNNDLPVQMLDAQEQSFGLEWEGSEVSSISLDLKTPLRHFPPFRFGVEFEEVHMLGDGQVKHSPEVFYAGSLWKISVQAFNDEDPQGRRTLGLFLHRRKAEPLDSSRKVHMYVDSREKVTARYQLICPSKREIMVFGNLKQPGTLLPKAPKGWGWRTALLFDELADLLQNGTLRVGAVVQLI